MDEKSLTREIEGLRYDRDMLLMIVHRFLREHEALSMDNTGKIVDRWPTLATDARNIIKSLHGGTQ
jgi:hypothetical protein